MALKGGGISVSGSEIDPDPDKLGNLFCLKFYFYIISFGHEVLMCESRHCFPPNHAQLFDSFWWEFYEFMKSACESSFFMLLKYF